MKLGNKAPVSNLTILKLNKSFWFNRSLEDDITRHKILRSPYENIIRLNGGPKFPDDKEI
jgi:hypothetical protein